MGRHVDHKVQDQAVLDVSQKEQADLLDKLGSMTRKALRVIYEAIVATKLCYMCLGRPGTDHEPLKCDSLGKCLNCAGSGRVPDFDRNKWGVNEVMARKLPMPKAIEMRVEDKTDKLALAKLFMGMKKDDVLAMEKLWNSEVQRLSKLPMTAIPAEIVHDEPNHSIPN